MSRITIDGNDVADFLMNGGIKFTGFSWQKWRNEPDVDWEIVEDMNVNVDDLVDQDEYDELKRDYDRLEIEHDELQLKSEELEKEAVVLRQTVKDLEAKVAQKQSFWNRLF